MDWKRLVVTGIVYITFFACLASAEDSLVKKTLKGYQIGITDFNDFTNDASLISVGASYWIATNSDWKLFSQSKNMSFSGGKFEASSILVVGDSNGPMCKLRFDGTGKLSAISFLTDTEMSPVIQGEQDDDDFIDQAMQKQENYFESADQIRRFDISRSPGLERVAGTNGGDAGIKALADQVRQNKIVFDSWKAEKPYTYLRSENPDTFPGSISRFAIIPCESIEIVNGKKFADDSFFLGIKISDFNWKFYNGSRLTSETCQRDFPGFPENFKLPEEKIRTLTN